MSEYFQGGYNESRGKRIKIIVEHYGADTFLNKRILEVGAGYGHIGAELASTYGSNVLCTEGRPEYVKKIKEMHSQVEAAVHDLEQPWPFKEKFDLILYMGVLHHLHPVHVETALTEACNASDNIVLDLEITDNEDPHLIVPTTENAYSQAMHHTGCRPTTAYIERILTELDMKFERVMDKRIDGPAIFTWEPGHAPAIGPRRFWFAWK